MAKQKATSRLKCNAPLGLRPSLENCRIFDLNIDPAYQRSTENGSSQSLIRKIAQHWDWALFHPLSVSRRRDGSLYVVDGQHRLAAARLRRDLYDLPCVVTAYDNAGDEAASFVAMNVQRRALGALDLFRAALAADDDASIAIAHLIRKAGLSLATHTNHTAWKPGQIANIGGIRDSYKRFGGEVTGMGLRAVSQAFEGQVLRYAGTLFSGAALYLSTASNEQAFDFDLFVLVLQGYSQADWIAEIAVEKGRQGVSWPIAASAVIGRAMAEALGDDEQEAA